MPYTDTATVTLVTQALHSNFTNTSGWNILTPDKGTPYPVSGLNGITLPLQGAQEFLYQDPVPTPEPGTIILLGSGLLGIFGFSRKIRTQLKS